MSTAEWIVLIALLFYLLTCLCIFDIARRDFGGIEKKAAWAFVSLIPFIGPLVYLAAGMRRGKRKR